MSNEALVGILRSHGASFSNATIEACLQDEDFYTWAKVHLTEDTLLSLDELELYVDVRPPFPPPTPFCFGCTAAHIWK